MTKSCRGSVLGVVVVVAVLSLLVPLVITSCGFLSLLSAAQDKRIRLLCRTDHTALLRACQELSRQFAAGQLRPGRYELHGGQWNPTFEPPETLRELQPLAVTIDSDGRVEVSMVGGLSHFGVIAYPDGYRELRNYGDRELIENLWYVDSQYLRGSDYDKVVDGILRKYGTTNDANGKGT